MKELLHPNGMAPEPLIFENASDLLDFLGVESFTESDLKVRLHLAH